MYEGTDKMKEKEKENAWGKQLPMHWQIET
jgi:hypothetical protein